MRNGQAHLLSCLFLLIWATPGLDAAAPAVNRNERKKSPAASRPAPAFTLDLAAAIADPPTWGAGHAAQLVAMEQLAIQAEGPLERARAHLAIANWLLAVPTSHAATRWLVALADDKDLTLLANSAAAAREHIEEAKRDLRAASEPAGRSEFDADDRVSRLEAAIAVLEPFIALLVAAVPSGADVQARQAAWGRVARGLASVRESTNESLAASALLWQAFAWQMAGRTERARSGLPEPLTPPTKSAFDFMARLLRCRLLSDTGRYTAATTLTIQVRRQCATWFKSESSGGAAPRQRLAALVQCQIGKRWLQQLKATPTPASGGPLETALGELQATYFDDRSEDQPQVCFLEATIPIIVTPPGRPPGKASSAQTNPAPGDTPESTSRPAPGEVP